MQMPKASTVTEIASCVLILVMASNVADSITNPYNIGTLLFCIAGLFYLKARAVNVILLLALCIFSAILGVLSLQFRDVVYNFGFWIMPTRIAGVDFPPQSIGLIDSRHIPLRDDDSVEMGLALFTNYARLVIERNQMRCDASVRVFQVGAYAHGMGSELHFHAAVLAQAVEQKALFAWGPASCTLFGVQCRGFYENEHNCSVDQMSRMETVAFEQWPEATVPRELLDVLPDSFTVQQALYWWRAQAIGYLMRFNAQTRGHVNRLRSSGVSLGGAINVNIRGGDKHTESRLTLPEVFVDKALELIDQSPLTYSRVIFITSDDPRAIVRAQFYAETRHLKPIYLDVPRMEFGNDAGKASSFWTYNITISMLLQLSMTSECAAWVGSRSSNWNRVIDMFRCTAKTNCRGPFVEVGDSVRGFYYHRLHGSI